MKIWLHRSRVFHHSGGLRSWLVLVPLLLAGCTGDPKPAAPDATSEKPAATKSATDAGTTYQLVFMKGARVGHSRQVEVRSGAPGAETVRTENVAELKLLRYNEVVEVVLRRATVETADGKLLSLEYETRQRDDVRKITGRVDGDRLIIEAEPGSRPQEIAWSGEIGGFFAAEQSLVAKPMRPGEERRLRQLGPLPDKIVDVELLARDMEMTDLLDGPRRLLHIAMTETLPDGQKFPTDLYCDDSGQVLKLHSDVLSQDTFQTTRELALAPFDPRRLDIGWDVVVRVAAPIRDAATRQEAVYRVDIAGDDPRHVFAGDGRQQVEMDADGRFLLRVQRAAPAEFAALGDSPTDADLAASGLVEADAPCIQELASQVAADQSDPAVIATALAGVVHGHMTRKDFTQVFSSAAEACASRQGDCTEHAMLLAALCRNRKIPARVAVGLVYLDSLPGFAYHMWTEAWTGDRWIGLDATRNDGGLTVGHLKLTHSSLEGASAYGSFFPVLRVLGKLKLEPIGE